MVRLSADGPLELLPGNAGGFPPSAIIKKNYVLTKRNTLGATWSLRLQKRPAGQVQKGQLQKGDNLQQGEPEKHNTINKYNLLLFLPL